MYGKYHWHIHHNPLKRVIYRLLGGPRVSDWIRFWHVMQAQKSLGLSGSLRILDAGCGMGFYSRAFAEQYPDSQITAIDDDISLVQLVKEAAGRSGRKNITATQADLLTYQPGQQYDLICCVDVLEHIVDHDRVFKSFAGWLKPGGVLILHVPQCHQKFLFTKRTYGGDDPHCREGYVPQELIALLERQGLMPFYQKQSFGGLAVMAVELDELLWKLHLYPIWVLFYPLFLALAWRDIHLSNSRGHGILIMARRNG